MTAKDGILHRLLAAVVVVGGASGAALTGCSDLAAACREGDCLGTGASTGSEGQGGGAGSSSTGGGGAGGTATPSCDPSMATDAVADSCGVFVSSSLGTDTSQGTGTKARPYATLAKALMALDSNGGNTIYLCGESFKGSIALPSGISVLGALDCKKGWAYLPSIPSTIAGDANSPALTVTGVQASALHDLAIVAADATVDGGNSIAMLVDGATVELDRVGLVAGMARAGATGTTLGGSGSNGKTGTSGKSGCTSSAMVVPEAPPTIDCGGGEFSDGGYGGSGMVSTAGNGFEGEATPSISNPNGGTGQPSNGGQCTNGQPGLPGTNGTPGEGASGLGTLDKNLGFVGIAGTNGKTKGHAGQGGGGGGGASGKQSCQVTTNAGPAGGSGGTGGCGGEPGNGGLAGGSSMALVILSAKVTLAHASLTAKDAGNGGHGSDGQPGGLGVSGGLGAQALTGSSCTGGKGGDGGKGGAGGGGLGGHSLPIAYSGPAPTLDDATVVLTVGAAGKGGDGGNGGTNNVGGKGADGLATEQRSFDPM